ncbi:MAG: polyphosphate polymerase domain-containing protein [Lachnospiraceae bacterium]|nr:polyphosphate polymerase domain-containing protein [Lachnospiraceae bacterium]
MGYETRFRHELKYEVGYGEYLCIRQRLRAICDSDPHTGDDGTYLIRSIYFDNIDNKALVEKVIGTSRREKFRIRYYNDDLSYITLEKKQKINDLCKKVECSLTKDELCDILSGDTAFMKEHKAGLVRELYSEMTMQQLRPKVLVSYRREPYIYRPGNVRVTFDFGIRTTMFSRNYIEDIHEVPATDDAQMMIMEVKYDDFLPNIISCIVNEGNIRQQSFSKYEACRKFG